MRELAVGALANTMDPRVIQTMIKCVNDRDEVVQVRAACYLASLVSTSKSPTDSPSGKVQTQALGLLINLFKEYGDDTKRSDADWGWRPVGNAIVCFGDEGEKQLKDMIAKKSDRRLAELAWQVVYIRQEVMKYCPVTEEEDAEAHAHHPFLKFH